MQYSNVGMSASIFTFLSLIYSASASIKLTATSTEVLPYEPLYIKMELEDLEHGVVGFGRLEYASTSIKLVIISPNGEESSYRSPLIIEDFGQGAPEATIYQFISVNNGRFVTSQTGTYEFFLKNLGGERVSNSLKVVVNQPNSLDDIRAKKIIERSPSALGMFLYLGGGDHLKAGHEIARELANGKSSYSVYCKFALMSNYSQESYDFSNSKVRRFSDTKLAEKYFLESDEKRIPPKVKIDALIKMKRLNPKMKLSPKVKSRIFSLRKEMKPTEQQEKEFQLLLE